VLQTIPEESANDNGCSRRIAAQAPCDAPRGRREEAAHGATEAAQRGRDRAAQPAGRALGPCGL